MKIINEIQGTESWLAWRKTKITASDMPIIVGISPWSTPYELWLQKSNRKEPQAINRSMQKGMDLESNARTYLEKKLGMTLNSAVIESDETSWAAASLDCLSEDKKTAIEVKVINANSHSESVLFDTIPSIYIPQLQYQMYVTGLQEILYFSYQSDEDNVLITVKRDQVVIDELVVAAEKFMYCLVHDAPPDLTEKDSLLNETPEFELLTIDYCSATRAVKEAEAIQKKARDALLEETAGGNMHNDQVKISYVGKKGAVDMDAVCAKYNITEADLDSYRKGSVWYPKLTITKGGKDV